MPKYSIFQSTCRSIPSTASCKSVFFYFPFSPPLTLCSDVILTTDKRCPGVVQHRICSSRQQPTLFGENSSVVADRRCRHERYRPPNQNEVYLNMDRLCEEQNNGNAVPLSAPMRGIRSESSPEYEIGSTDFRS